MTDEWIVTEKKTKLDKKNKKSVDPVALLTSQLAEQAWSNNAYNGATDDDGEALEKAMILLSQHYQKKFHHQSGSNNLRFTSGSRVKVPETKKVVACFNCEKSGHISKECRAKLDHSDNEADKVETATLCFVGDDQSDDDDDSSIDTDERKRRRSKKSKKQDNVIPDSSNSFNSSDSNLSDRTLSARSKQKWRVKRTSDDSTTDEDLYVDKHYKSDSFVVCNKISKYSIKQMIQISKNVSYSSSDSSSDDYAFSSSDSSVHSCAYNSDNFSRAFNVKSYKYFPIRTATNKHGPKFKWVPKSQSDSKLKAPHVKGE
ncbi:hypothetical protein L6452_18331 [Arctium lappa]|uniref:Uncharacterized protein n=1 Tax=Arctium lappa TaxID=4217 RepID=A0ACB9C5W3_ARCLA|nr:hypothetical protein L6452_18331 [Arctium lappa]